MLKNARDRIVILIMIPWVLLGMFLGWLFRLDAKGSYFLVYYGFFAVYRYPRTFFRIEEWFIRVTNFLG
jgi:hypothetical protein